MPKAFQPSTEVEDLTRQRVHVQRGGSCAALACESADRTRCSGAAMPMFINSRQLLNRFDFDSEDGIEVVVAGVREVGQQFASRFRSRLAHRSATIDASPTLVAWASDCPAPSERGAWPNDQIASDSTGCRNRGQDGDDRICHTTGIRRTCDSIGVVGRLSISRHCRNGNRRLGSRWHSAHRHGAGSRDLSRASVSHRSSDTVPLPGLPGHRQE